MKEIFFQPSFVHLTKGMIIKMNNITIKINNTIENLEKSYTYKYFAEIYQEENEPIIVAAQLNNSIKELNSIIEYSGEVSFIDLSMSDGVRIYKRSLIFLFLKAVKDLYPEMNLIICHSVSRGIFFENTGSEEITKEKTKKIEDYMRELVKRKLPIVKRILPMEKAMKIFENLGREDMKLAIKHRTSSYAIFYRLDELEDYFYGFMVPDTGYLKVFKLECMEDGIVLISPKKHSPLEIKDIKIPMKLFSVFKEYRNWNSILHVQDAGSLNQIISKGKINDFIRIQEALHEKKIGQIADLVCQSEEEKKFILISGPSSSGKTTFANRLSIQLRVNGIEPIIISFDDYYRNTNDIPLDENGDKDFERLDALDVELFNKHLNSIMNGEEVVVPIFNFEKGEREEQGRILKLKPGQKIIFEGIHGLNPKLTYSVPEKSKFKIYISAITSMRIDDHNRIPTTDSRVIRRIVRDYQFRNCPIEKTMHMWPSVREGEELYIFPYQEEADVMFNSSMLYELGVLKTRALPLLVDIDITSPSYSEARRLINFLGYFLHIETNEIPPNSIIREFIGGSCFYK